MLTFEYRARDKAGKVVTGVADAASPEAVAANLKKLGYAIVSVNLKQAISAQHRIPLFDRFNRPKTADVSMFTRQLATLIDAGIPILSGLESIKEQSSNAQLKEIISQSVADIRGGISLADALAKHSSCFNSTYINMIKAAEMSGKLTETLDRLAAILEYDEQTKAKIMQATRYPVTVTAALVIAFLVLTMLVLPKFINIYSKFNMTLPLPTRILLGINFVMSHYWYLVILIVVGSTIGLRYYIRTKKGRYVYDGLALKMPVFGDLILKISLSRFVRTAGLMLKSGVPILKVLDQTANVAGNVIITDAILKIKEDVNVGKSMASSMKQDKLFPPVVVQMVSLGEESGKLDELFVRVSNFFDAQIDMTIGNLTSLLEPILILCLGLGVLTMALSVFLPMWNMVYIIKK